MKAPHPLPSSRPWSPVGYQVVQVADEQQANGTAPGVNVPPAPHSPLGYRLVQVAEEQTPAPAAAQRPVESPPFFIPDIERRGEAPRQRARDWPYIIPTAVAGSVFVFVVLVAIASSMSVASNREEAPPVARGNDVANLNFFGGPGMAEAVIPAGLRDGPARDAIDDAKPAPVLAKEAPIWAIEPKGPCQQCGERESFGTSVQFVRNPQEAARMARAQHKLTFVLHVSGNFEDSRFT